MVLLELALNGIRNFTTWTKIPFRPGFNWIRGANGSGKSTIAASIVTLLSPEDRPDLENSLLRADESPAQGAVAFKANNGTVYRIAKDFRKGVLNLFTLDANRKFALLEKKRDPIRKFLVETVGFADGRTVFSLLWTRFDQMPSASARSRGARSPVSSVVLPSSGTSGREEMEKNLEQLREAAREAERLNALEAHISDVHAASADLKRRISTIVRLQNEIAEENEKLELSRPFENAGPNLEALLDAFEDGVREKEDRVSESEERRRGLDHEREKLAEVPIWQNPIFVGGCAGLFLSFVAGLFINLEGIFKQVYLAALFASIGAVVFSVFLDLRNAARRRDLGRRLEGVEKERDAVESRFTSVHAVVVGLLKSTDSPDVAVLRERFYQYTFVRDQRDALKKELEGHLGGKNLEDHQGDLAALSDKLRQAEEELRASAGSVQDPYSLQEEIRRIEEDLSGQDPILDIPSIPSPGDAAPPAWPGVAGASALLSDRRDAAISYVSEAFVRFSPGGALNLSINASFEPELSPSTIISTLSAGTADQIALAYLFGCLKAGPKDGGLPVLWDDPLLRLDATRRAIALELLRDAAKGRQILFFTGLTDASRPEDHTVQLR